MRAASDTVKLNVPFKEKDMAKSLGARWSREDRAWFAPAGSSVEVFAKWTAGNSARERPPRELNLDKMAFAMEVPFDQRDEAKAGGAVWDWSRKAYFAPIGKEASLERFRVRPAIASGGSGDPERLFGEALREAGLDCPLPVMDGKPHRVPLLAGSRSARDGAYIGYADGRPSGFIQNWKTGLKTTWSCGSGERAPMSASHRAAWSAQLELSRLQREKAASAAYEAAAEKAQAAWKAAPADPAAHAYLDRKGCAQHGAKVSGDALLIDARDIDGKLWTIQTISADPDGKKLFLKGGRKTGCFHTKPIAIVEGFATGATVHESTGYPVVVAFDAGNLLPVGMALARRYRSSLLAFMADNDRHGATNVGVEKACAAAQEIGAAVVIPVFGPAPSNPTDWNDLASLEGLDSVAAQIRTGLRDEQARAKQEAKLALLEAYPDVSIEQADWRKGRSHGTAIPMAGGLLALRRHDGVIELHETRLLQQTTKPGASVTISYSDGRGKLDTSLHQQPSRIAEREQ
jgi:putative DNA primase/helicase